MNNRDRLVQKTSDELSSSPDWAFANGGPNRTMLNYQQQNQQNINTQYYQNQNSEMNDRSMERNYDHFSNQNNEEDGRRFLNSSSNRDDDEYSDDETDVKRLLNSSSTIQPIVEDFTLEFFRPLLTTDIKARGEALEQIIDLLKNSLQTEKKELLKTHLQTIVRFATEVPFDDIMQGFQQLISHLEQNGITIPQSITIPSTFIRKNLFQPVNTTDKTYKKIFVDLFLTTGRVSHLSRVMSIHPTYFEKFWATFAFVMTEPGPLPLSWRNYIAILASVRQKCKYLVVQQENEFLLNGGDPKWLDGIDFIPKKLYNLLNVNQILSHQPWIMTKEHAVGLLKGEDSWSIGELVSAMVIICTFNSLAGIVLGCGVTNEVDLDRETIYPTNILEQTAEEEEQEKDSSNIVESKKITELLKEKNWENEESEEQPQEIFAKAETAIDQTPSSSSSYYGDGDRFSKYIGKFDMQHLDFDMKAKGYSIFRVQDWNWKEDGFELARRFLPGAAVVLDEEYDHIYSMTYNQFYKSENVDTFPFRRAIWQYVQRIKGAFHDDYNYQEVNLLLNKAAKSYIKKICCYPYLIKKSDFQDVGYEITPDEKVHVALLAVESSKQSALLYGLHAVMKHMYNN